MQSITEERAEGARQSRELRVTILRDGGRSRDDLLGVLRPIGAHVVEADGLEALLGDSRSDLVVLDYDRLNPTERASLLQPGQKPRRAPLVVTTEKGCGPDLGKLLGAHVLTNLVSRSPNDDEDDLKITVTKLLQGDIFGLEKYLPWASEPRIFRINSSIQKAEVLDLAEAYAQSVGAHPRLVTQFCGVADELITNGIFNAPVDANGKPRHRHTDRTNEVILGPGEELEVKLASDGKRLGISAADPFGSLQPGRVLDYLAKGLRKGADQIDEKLGGAGLGLYFVFVSLSHFVVNISPGKRTEMIGLLDVRGSYRHFASRQKSFNIFMGA